MAKRAQNQNEASRKKAPERLSGYELINYLTADQPGPENLNLRWHTLRSCMWVRLLSACPQYARYGDYNKISRSDMKKILSANWQLVTEADTKKLLYPWDWSKLIMIHPELADHCDLTKLDTRSWEFILEKHPGLAARCPQAKLAEFSGRAWVCLLKAQPGFADQCPWEEFSGYDWAYLLQFRPDFADRCDWSKFSYANWYYLITRKPCFLARFTLDQFLTRSAGEYGDMLADCYIGDTQPPKGVYKDFSGNAASYMIYKSMDTENSRKYLRTSYHKKRWDFLEELYDISPDELTRLTRNKQTPFLIALAAPDSLFEKYFHSVDPELRDIAGNTLLHCAMIHDQSVALIPNGLLHHRMDRYKFMLDHGCSPNVRNAAGFSCGEWLRRMKPVKTIVQKRPVPPFLR